MDTFMYIEELLTSRMVSAVVFAGSAHVVRNSVRLNTAFVVLPGAGAWWTHNKTVPYQTREGRREGIDTTAPEITIACGNHVRLATAVCKDLLSTDFSRLLGDLGVHLLGVPAMSEGLGDFAQAAHTLVARSQGALVVANNPRVWNGKEVETALLGHPIKPHHRTDAWGATVAPGFTYGVLGKGWRDFEPVQV